MIDGAERTRPPPFVSVVIPTRDRAGLLRKAIASALTQTHRELEVVVVDDASEDKTPDLLEELSRAEPRLRVVCHHTPGGAAGARNRGVAAARGSVIAFLDDDCVWASRKLERQLPLLTGTTGVVYCRQAIRSLDGQWIVEGEPGAVSAPLDSLLRTNYIGTPGLVVRRDLFQAVGGFDESLPRLQDWDLLLRLARETQFEFVPEVLVKGVEVEGGITLTADTLPRAARRVIDEHLPFLTRRQGAALRSGLGKFLLADGHTSPARSFFRESVRLDPTSPLNWAGLLASFLGPAPARAVRGWRRRRRAAAAESSLVWDLAPAPPDSR